MAQSISYSPVGWNEVLKAVLERLLGTCQQHQMVMQVTVVASQIMTWVAVQEMDCEELLHNIETLNPFKVHPEEAHATTIPSLTMLWLNSFSQPKLYLWAALSELIEDTDKKLVELSSLLYHHTDRLNMLETLTGSEFELIEQWVAMVKGLDQQGNTQSRLQSR
ncbi:hypothetical protein J3A83DRAFT_4188408 [Scleroderma citrinum]